MTRDYQIKKRTIDSMLENFDWETNPKWVGKLDEIKTKIDEFWTIELNNRHRN